jgi:hypothetical protein
MLTVCCLATPPAPVNLRGGLDPSDDGETKTDPRELVRRYGGREWSLWNTLMTPTDSSATSKGR